MNKYTLITGATSGIGYALAKEFAERKHNLIISSRNSAKMLEIKNTFENQYRISVITLVSDYSIKGTAESIYHLCKTNDYQVEILVNNSGFGLETKLQVDQPLTEVKDLLEVNVNSLVLMSTLFGKDMKERRSGFILNIASTAAFQPMPFAALYGASKAFVLSFSEAMAMEMKDHNVGVTAVCPGITDTNFFRQGKPNVPSWLYKLVSPELVAKRGINAMYKKQISLVPYFQHWMIAQISRFFTRKTTAHIMRTIETHRKKVRLHYL